VRADSARVPATNQRPLKARTDESFVGIGSGGCPRKTAVKWLLLLLPAMVLKADIVCDIFYQTGQISALVNNNKITNPTVWMLRIALQQNLSINYCRAVNRPSPDAASINDDETAMSTFKSSKFWLQSLYSPAQYHTHSTD